MKFAVKKIAIRTLLAGVLASVMLTPCLAATSLSFHDVSAETDVWCYTQIVKAAEVCLMNGYGNGVFGKNDPVTRGQIVQVLYNYYGEDRGTDSGFPDVPSSAWYAKAVAWASGEGIVSGYPDGAFRPNAPLTREQMVTVLYNLAGRPDVDGSVLTCFRDRAQVADYAADSFAWALPNEIISGTDADTLSPRSTATRAQTAVILVRYLERVEGTRFPDVTVPAQPEQSELRWVSVETIQPLVMHPLPMPMGSAHRQMWMLPVHSCGMKQSPTSTHFLQNTPTRPLGIRQCIG